MTHSSGEGGQRRTALRSIVLAGAALALGAALFAQPVKITGYLIGAAPEGAQPVFDALNAKLEADLGVKLEINYIGWNEVNSKYPLVLAGGEGVDWIFTADWAPYTTQAVRGAFRELTPELLRKNMPRHWAATPAGAWDEARVNGRIYMIPTATPDYKLPLALIRGDLRKKYGLAPITSVRDLGPYLAAVKKREPDLIPINLGNGYDIGQPFIAVLNPDVPPIFSAFFGLIYGNYEDPRHGLVNLLDDKNLPAFRKAAKVMKQWYDSGYINIAPFANPVLSKQSFAAGKSAVGFGNSQDIQEVLALAQSKGFDPEIIPILSSTGHSVADSYTGNGAAIAAGCKRVDLALRTLDLLMEDPAYARLAYFGIEGKNYILTADGRIALPRGVTPESNTYPVDAAGFWFLDKDRLPPLASWTPTYLSHRSALKSFLVPNAFLGFTFVPNRIKNEIASITSVMDQYWAPLAIGAVADVDRAVEDLASKLASARQDKALLELKDQLAAFEQRRKH
jgi:putative aldouronate transport system substrate-binding protein